MDVDSICFKEQLAILKYINEHYLFYSITIFTFISLFVLVWILSKYTYFEKHKITRARIPTFPYGNFGDVIKQQHSLHLFIWKHYNKFKRKGCKYGGLFLFVKPVILITDSTIAANINKNNGSFVNMFPSETKLDQRDINKILNTDLLITFVEKYNYSVKGALPQNLLKNETSIVLREFLLESLCLAFGFHPFKMMEEINQLLRGKYNASLRYYISLLIPFLCKNQNKLNSDLSEVFLEIMEDRKKNDLHENDFVQSFISMYNQSNSNYTTEDITQELFNIFADTLTYSYSTLLLCLYELANNEEIQEEVVGEIRRFNKNNKKLTYTNIGDLIYLDAVVKGKNLFE